MDVPPGHRKGPDAPVITTALALLASLALARGAVAQRPWTFSVPALVYFTPEARYIQPTFTADHRRLHLEARYNYEGMETGSAWVGVNFAGGGDVRWELTPIAGVAFGRTTGAAPGYRGSLAWWKLELLSEGEYLYDLDQESSSFFYSWSELAFLPREFVRLGVVAQRTKAYQSERDLQRGLLIGFAAPRLRATAYLFNPDDAEPTFVVGVEVEF